MMFGNPFAPQYQFFEDWNMVVPTGKYNDIVVRRSWKERLFSLPWRPREKTKTIQIPEIIPDPNYYQIGNRIVGHPQSIRRLKDAIGTQVYPHAQSPHPPTAL
jgi:hypothetical protein